MSTVVLSGGVGGARFLSGMVNVIPPSSITVISNTGDDTEFFGLHVCPDIDIVLYTLADLSNTTTGWGLKDDTSAVLDQLGKLGCDTWFHLGDRDFATQIYRTALLREGKTLTQVTQLLAKQLGLSISIFPMSDQSVSTAIYNGQEILPFQDYMVKHCFHDQVRSIQFNGIDQAKPAPGVLDAIDRADQIILAPSNPYVSIGAILSVPGIRQHLQSASAPVAAISPIVGGKVIKGPAAHMLAAFGKPVSPVSVAELYADFLDLFIMDIQDANQVEAVEALGIRAVATQTMMTSRLAKNNLAQIVLDELSHLKTRETF